MISGLSKEVEVSCGANKNPVKVFVPSETPSLHGVYAHINAICHGCTNHTLAKMAQLDAELGFSQYGPTGIKETREQFLKLHLIDAAIPLGEKKTRIIVSTCSTIGAE